MKNYEEMTRSVLDRAEKVRAERKKTRRVAGVAAICACSVALAVLVGTQLRGETPGVQPENPTALTAPQSPRITLLSAAAGDGTQQKLGLDVVTPFAMKIRVRDVRGQDQSKALKEEQAYAKSVQEASPADDRMEQFVSKTAIITLVSDGHFCLVVKDYDRVESVSVTTTAAGRATYGPYSLTDGESGFMVFWSLSDETVERIEKDPGLKLSEIRDTVTAAVKFSDGSTETAVIDMTVDEEGQVYAVHRGVSATA